MAYYVIRVAPRQEEAFLRLGSRLLDQDVVTVVFPRRRMEHLKAGHRIKSEVALFPGYVFLRVDEGMNADLYTQIKAIPGFGNFLKQGDALSELRGSDLELLSHFLRFGEVTPSSLVYFDADQKIRVVSGPMEGLEGQVVHVDKRKRRAKIRLDFDHSTFTVTLGFELMVPVVAQELRG